MSHLYQQQLMDHYRYPRNRGVLQNPDFCSGQCNPSCGDMVGMQGILDAGRVTQLMFQGVGCVISQAMASMLTDDLLGYTIEAIMALGDNYVQERIGTALGPVRIKCALLSLQALQEGLRKYSEGRDA